MGEMHYAFWLSQLKPVCTANTSHWRMIYCAVSDCKPTQYCVCLTENSPRHETGVSLAAPSRKAAHALIRAGNTQTGAHQRCQHLTAWPGSASFAQLILHRQGLSPLSAKVLLQAQKASSQQSTVSRCCCTSGKRFLQLRVKEQTSAILTHGITMLSLKTILELWKLGHNQQQAQVYKVAASNTSGIIQFNLWPAISPKSVTFLSSFSQVWNPLLSTYWRPKYHTSRKPMVLTTCNRKVKKKKLLQVKPHLRSRYPFESHITCDGCRQQLKPTHLASLNFTSLTKLHSYHCRWQWQHRLRYLSHPVSRRWWSWGKQVRQTASDRPPTARLIHWQQVGLLLAFIYWPILKLYLVKQMNYVTTVFGGMVSNDIGTNYN